jgi:hypothetical protein
LGEEEVLAKPGRGGMKHGQSPLLRSFTPPLTRSAKADRDLLVFKAFESENQMRRWTDRGFKISVVFSGLFLFSHCFFPEKTFAYIDPGAGSYFLQILVAGLLAFLYSLKVYWKRIKDSLFLPIIKQLKRRS